MSKIDFKINHKLNHSVFGESFTFLSESLKFALPILFVSFDPALTLLLKLFKFVISLELIKINPLFIFFLVFKRFVSDIFELDFLSLCKLSIAFVDFCCWRFSHWRNEVKTFFWIEMVKLFKIVVSLVAIIYAKFCPGAVEVSFSFFSTKRISYWVSLSILITINTLGRNCSPLLIELIWSIHNFVKIRLWVSLFSLYRLIWYILLMEFERWIHIICVLWHSLVWVITSLLRLRIAMLLCQTLQTFLNFVVPFSCLLFWWLYKILNVPSIVCHLFSPGLLALIWICLF